MSIVYVSRVASNVKRRVDVELGPKTLIVGDNGAGKSAITDSICLALTGTVDEVAGKESTSQAIALMVLKAAAEDESLHARVEITTDDVVHTAEWEAEGSTAKASRPKHRLPEIIQQNAVTIRDLRSVLSKGQDAIRDLFMHAISDEIAYDDVFARLESDEAKEFFKEGHHIRNTDAHPQQPEEPALDTLEACITEADKKKRHASAEASRLESLAAVTREPPTKADLDSARAAFEKASKRRDEAAAKLGQLRAAKHQEAASGAPGVPPALRTLITLLTHLVDKKREECPICATKRDVRFFEERLHKAKNKAFVLTSSAKSSPSTSKEETAAADDLVSARKAESDASEHFAQLCRAKEEFENYQASRSKKVKAERDSALWKSIEVELTRVRDSLLESGVSKLEARVQKYLGVSDKFKIVLGAGERRVCYYGLERNGHVDVALSGGEEVRVQIALACAMAKGALNVVIPADRSLSFTTLTNIMTATVDAPVQIIINTTTDAPSVPEGWKLIRLEDQR